MDPEIEDPQILSSLFNALDSVLSVHYASSTTVPKINDVCEKATRLTKRRVDLSTIERILSYDPHLYQVVHYGSKLSDYGLCGPRGTSPLQFGTLIPRRKASFMQRVSAFKGVPHTIKLSDVAVPTSSTFHKASSNMLAGAELSKNGNLDAFGKSPAPNIKGSKCERILTKSSMRHSQVNSEKNSFKVNKSELSNTMSGKKLKKSTLTDGLSLIERIKQKERERKLNSGGISIEENHACYIKSKIPMVYDILYEMTIINTGGQKSFKTFLMAKLISVIKDSLSYSMTDEEISDTITMIAQNLLEKVKIIQSGDIHAIKVLNLNRNQDLSILNTTT